MKRTEKFILIGGFTCIASTFGIASNIEVIDQYFSGHFVSEHKNHQLGLDTHRTIDSFKTTSGESAKLNISTRTLSDNSLTQLADTSQSNGHHSIKKSSIINNEPEISIVGIDGTGRPEPIPAEGIDGTGKPELIPLTGIDGTGAPKPIPSEGIDGTGRPEPLPAEGIDGSGGPVVKDIADAPKIYDTIEIISNATALGTLERSDGSFIVNGITFITTEDTKITIDGSTNNDISELRSGHVVTIKGKVDENNNGIATEIIYNTQISGEITEINGNVITVLKQTIILDEETVFGGSATKLSDLKVGDTINASGHLLSNGDLSATRIERTEDTTDKIIGPISGLNTQNETFLINDLTIGYGSIATLATSLENGMTVNITGSVDGEDSNVLNATSVNTVEPAIGTNGDNETKRIELEGFITQFTDASSFKVGGISTSTDYQTVFDGNDRKDLELNVKVEVEGSLNNDNILVAEKVIFLTAGLTSHKNRGKISSSTETFKWKDVGAKAYRLMVMNTNHEVHYDETFDGNTLSTIVENLPSNASNFAVHLFTQQGEFWYEKKYNLQGSGESESASLTSHSHGEILENTTETFTWNYVAGADSYRLRIFDAPTNKNYYDNVFTTPEAVTLSSLPTNGADMTIQLSTFHNGWESAKYYDVKSLQIMKNAELLSHQDGQQLKQETETFFWNDVGAEAYELRVARTTIKKDDTYDWFEVVSLETFDGSTTSATINNLPINGAQVQIRLRTRHNGAWGKYEYWLTGAQKISSAELTSHENNDIITSNGQILTWSEVPEAEKYHLTIRNPVVDSEKRLSEDYDNFVTSATINNLPKSNAIAQVTLSTRHNGYWAHNTYNVRGTGELPSADITSHTGNQIITTPSITITWNDVNADVYHLKVENRSSSPWTKLHNQEHGPETTSVSLENLPDNSNLFITISTKHEDWWSKNERFLITRLVASDSVEKTLTHIKVSGSLEISADNFIVNGITFTTTEDTKITVDGITKTDTSALRSGQVVTIKGNVDEDNNGVATEIIYNTQISGKITEITDKSITVLKQSIVLHEEILFGGTATQLSDLKVGDTISASGYLLSNGSLSATRIERTENTTDKIIGPVSELNALNETFLINGLTIDYGLVATLTTPLENGMTVNVTGTADNLNADVLNATAVDTVSSITDSSGSNETQRIELEGFITQFTSADEFSIGGISTLTNFQTQFIGNEREDLQLNTKVEVEGYLDNNNVLIAEKVLFLTAGLTSHKDRGKISSSTQTFEWNNVNAKAYRLIVMNTNHKVHYDQVFNGNTLSTVVENLPPNNSSFAVHLYTQQGSFWYKKTYNLNGAGEVSSALLTSHAHGDVLTNTTETFNWSYAEGADSYRLRIFDPSTNKNYYDNTFTTPEAVTLSDLPTNGADMTVQISTFHNGWESAKYYDLKSVKLLLNATLTSHTNNQQLTSGTQTFTWDDVGADAYEFSVIRTVIQKNQTYDWYETVSSQTFNGSTTSVTIDNLPINGGQVLIRLRTQHNGAWGKYDYWFTGVNTIASAELTSHSNNDIMADDSQTFTWSEVPEADKYQLTIRNPVIDSNKRFSEDYDNFITSATINNLPKSNAVAQVTLSTRHNGYWAHKTYNLRGIGDERITATINSHTEDQKISTPSATISWNDVNADGYHLRVQNRSSSPWKKLHDQEHGSEITSVTLENLPSNALLFITISTKHGDWWSKQERFIHTQTNQ